MPEGKENQVWYNYTTENNQTSEFIKKKMENRILLNRLNGNFQKAIFFENGVKVKEIQKIN